MKATPLKPTSSERDETIRKIEEVINEIKNHSLSAAGKQKLETLE
jgi:hypothetical protein